MPRFTAHRAFFALAGGQLVSTLGSGMTRFGLDLWVLSDEVGGSAADYTTMLFAAILPLGVASLFVGPLIDRWNRRWTMIFANAGASAPTIVVAVLYFSDSLEVWHLYIALVANGVASAFILPALDASTPMLMPQDQLGRAAGVTQMLQSFEIILAPVLAVPLFLGLGLGAVFVVDFVTFAISIIMLGLSLIPQPTRVLQQAGASVLDEFRFGVTYIVERRPFLLLILFVSVAMLVMPGIGYALATPLSLAISDEAGAAAVLTSFGVGSLVAGVLLAAWGGPKRRMNGILGSMILAGIGGVVTGVSESLVVTAAGVFIIGASFVFAIGLNRVIWQVKAAPEVLGRVFALRVMIGVVAQSTGIIVAGPLADGVFEPLLVEGAALAGSIGQIIGVGEGRGMGLMYILAGFTLIAFATISFIIRPIWRLEDALPDQQSHVESESEPEAELSL
ncbi:MAG: MFS transporter [Chloroflexi bacterium]|nr:MFS transporter [Chloroflexota bacterium]MYD15905.1 MFS transporter [Chloroflexota bacterium]